MDKTNNEQTVKQGGSSTKPKHIKLAYFVADSEKSTMSPAG